MLNGVKISKSSERNKKDTLKNLSTKSVTFEAKSSFKKRIAFFSVMLFKVLILRWKEMHYILKPIQNWKFYVPLKTEVQ